MKTEYLQYLVQLSQCKSISLAAEKCHISQQAFSAAMKQLEQELEAPLLIRTYQGVSLTPQGKDALAFAKLVLHHYEELKTKLQTPTGPVKAIKGNVQVYAGPAVVSSVLYYFLPDFYQAYPHITLDLRDQEISTVYTTIAGCNADNCIGIVHAPINESDEGAGPYSDKLHFTPLFEEKLVACVSKYSALAKHKKLSVNTILKYPLVMYVAEAPQTNIIYSMLSAYGQPKLNLTTGNPYIFFQSISKNIGIGIVPALALKNPAAQESLEDIQLIPLKENLHTTYGYLLPKIGQPSPALEAFVQALQSCKF